jgi:hypothetical protein
MHIFYEDFTSIFYIIKQYTLKITLKKTLKKKKKIILILGFILF